MLEKLKEKNLVRKKPENHQLGQKDNFSFTVFLRIPCFGVLF
jgi:hypothetical protein